MNGRIIRPLFGVRVSPFVERLLFVLFVVVVALVMPHTPDGLVGLSMIGAGVAGMYVDAQCVLSDAQALSGAATTVSTNAYDSGAAANNIEMGEPMALCFTVDVAADVADGDETYRFDLIQSTVAALTSPDILLSTAVAFLTKAKLVKGYRFYLPIPSQLKTKQFLGAQYVLGGTTPSITITSEIVPLQMVQNEKVYAANFTISS